MPATVHNILIHGPQVILNSLLPVGMLGEDAAESRNKYYKTFRLSHSRKFSRAANLNDVFMRSMDTSDPIISSLSLNSRICKRKRLAIPKEVVDLPAGHERRF